MLYTQEIGSIKKPRYLIDKFRAYIGGEISYDDLIPYIKSASIDTIRMLEASGLDIVFDGEMHRWEMYFHPIIHIDGIEIAGQVRVWDNYYFIKGRVVDEPRLRENYHLEETKYIVEKARKKVKIPVTGPYTIADWTFNEYYLSKSVDLHPVKASYEAKRQFTLDIARNVINPILKELSSLNIFRIQIDEPAATTHPNEMDIVVEAFNEAVKGVDTDVSVHICYSDYKILLPYMNDFKTVQFTLEFANRDSWELGVENENRVGYGFLRDLEEYGYKGELGLGVIDVHTDRVESPELVRDRVLYALKYIEPSKLYVNPDCGLRTRTRDIAYIKLRNMVKGVDLVRKELGL